MQGYQIKVLMQMMQGVEHFVEEKKRKFPKSNNTRIATPSPHQGPMRGKTQIV